MAIQITDPDSCRNTGKTYLGEGMHCPSAPSYVVLEILGRWHWRACIQGATTLPVAVSCWISQQWGPVGDNLLGVSVSSFFQWFSQCSLDSKRSFGGSDQLCSNSGKEVESS